MVKTIKTPAKKPAQKPTTPKPYPKSNSTKMYAAKKPTKRG